MNIQFSEAVVGVQEMVNGFLERIPFIILGLIVFALFILVGRLFRRTIRRFALRRRRHKNLGMALGRVVYAVITLIGFLVAMVIILPTFKPSQLFELLGISSIAIGFAFRDILQNFLAGILLLLTEPFRIEDQIKVGEFEGTVEDIQTRATTIRTYDGRRVVIPNADLFTKSVTVQTAYDKRRLDYDFSIGTSDDIDLAKEVIVATLRRIEIVLEDPAPDVIVASLEASSVNLRARWWIKPPRYADAMDAKDQVIAEVKKNLIKQGIDLPYPTQQILFHDQTEETDGDRRRQREGWPAGAAEPPRPRTLAGAIHRLAESLSTADLNNRTAPARDS